MHDFGWELHITASSEEGAINTHTPRACELSWHLGKLETHSSALILLFLTRFEVAFLCEIESF